ncbi:MAG: DUF1413 domain-containing protein [Lactobacillaceae bacterium]
MPKTINIRLTDDQYDTLLKEVSVHKTNVSDYIRKKLFYQGGWQQWLVDKQINQINNAIWHLPVGSTFTLPELLGYSWDKLSRGEKLALAKRYVKTVYQDNQSGDYSIRLVNDLKNDRNNKPKQFRKTKDKNLEYFD